jgi:Protein of unknown function (DUF1264)
MNINRLIVAVGLLALGSLAIRAQERNGSEPGGSRTGKTKALEAGAEMLQTEAPLRSIHAHVCGFHFYNGEPQRQVIAHHYCSHRGEDFLQCVIYDSDKPDARLIGIEYIISEKLFQALPEEEKKLWHSHVYEVKSGALIAPRLPNLAENELMKKLVGTYGKTWHTWQVDRGDQLPLGVPQLMMGFTADGQANPQMVAERDQGYGISSAEKKKARAEIAAPAVQPGADAWQTGEIIQLEPKMIAPATQQ